LVSNAQITSYYTTPQSGTGTYYGPYTSGGACTLDPIPSWANDQPVGNPPGPVTVAMNNPQWAGSAVCGLCAHVTGSGVGSGANPITGPFTAYVNDLCPGCATGSLDLGNQGDGAWAITWTAIACPVVGNVQFLFQGSNPFFIKLQARNTPYPIQSLNIISPQMVTMPRTTDNFFQANLGTSLTFPITVQVTDIFGSVITEVITAIDNTNPSNGAHQFPLQGTISPSSSKAVVVSSSSTLPASSTLAASSHPVAASSNPVAASSNPVAASSNPVAASSNPVAASSNPVAASSNPVAGSSNPVAASSNPVAASSNPVAASSNPVAASSNPVAGSSNPVAGSSNPVAASSNPVAGSSNPVAGSSNPVAASSNPVATSFGPSVCGDGIIQPPEQCDPGTGNFQFSCCTPNCQNFAQGQVCGGASRTCYTKRKCYLPVGTVLRCGPSLPEKFGAKCISSVTKFGRCDRKQRCR